jgi:hypothetical protein
MWVERLVIVAVMLGAGASAAADGDAVTREQLEARCRAACAPVIARCVVNLQGAFGDMREQCERITIEKCLRQGPAECEKAAPGLRPSGTEATSD